MAACLDVVWLTCPDCARHIACDRCLLSQRADWRLTTLYELTRSVARKAAFDLGKLRIGIPMHQTSIAPDARGDRAVYEGRYVVQDADPRADFPLFVTIARRGGHAQRRQVEAGSPVKFSSDHFRDLVATCS